MTIRDDGNESTHLAYLQLDRKGRRVALTRSPVFKTERYFHLKGVSDFDGDGVVEIIGEEIVHSRDSVSTRVIVLAIRPSSADVRV